MGKINLILGASILLVSGQVNAALIDATTISFNASGSPNTIAGTWGSGSIIVGASQNIEYFTVEIIDLLSDYGSPSSIAIESGVNHNRIAFCSNSISCISGASTNNLVTVNSSATQSASPWQFLLSLVEGSASQVTSGQTSISYNSGGGTAIANGSILVRTYDFTIPSPVPVPAAIWLFGTGLLGLVGFGKRRKSV
ncbi:MAG TPA: VPLPA-CTERM sorting domain-containing protein [Gammaproteobacteria bacterium]|nr:VPLPA-CTERM sorting domain-containing protein [Gammaproteobacteria bacterium]